MRRFGVAVLAFIVGVAALFAVQFSVTKIWSIQGITWGPENLPLAAIQQVASLTTLFTAILGGSLVAAIVSGRDRWSVLTAMCLVGIAIDGYFMFVRIGEALPLWYRVTFVSLIPAATVVAGIVADLMWPRETREADNA